MPSSLGLAGDLDDVDLIEDIEEAFDIRFLDEEIEGCWTVGHLFELVKARLPVENAEGRCASAMCFYRLRRAMWTHLAIELRPKTPIKDLNHISVREIHRIISEDCRLRPPPPVISLWGGLALLLTFALPLGALALGWPWWIAFVLAVGSFALFKVAPVRLPQDLLTFGDLVQSVSSRNIGNLSRDGARLRPSEAWAAFKDIISDHSLLPTDEIEPETLILAPKRASA